MIIIQMGLEKYTFRTISSLKHSGVALYSIILRCACWILEKLKKVLATAPPFPMSERWGGKGVPDAARWSDEHIWSILTPFSIILHKLFITVWPWRKSFCTQRNIWLISTLLPTPRRWVTTTPVGKNQLSTPLWNSYQSLSDAFLLPVLLTVKETRKPQWILKQKAET